MGRYARKLQGDLGREFFRWLWLRLCQRKDIYGTFEVRVTNNYSWDAWRQTQRIIGFGWCRHAEFDAYGVRGREVMITEDDMKRERYTSIQAEKQRNEINA